jgi:nucleoside-diphosphate-sugar epimerase
MILVTGGTGFIGRHVIRVLRQKVDAQIIRLLLLESEQDKQVDFPGMQAVFGDLSDMQSAEDAVSGVDTIVHSASKNIDHDGTGFHRINVEGTRHLCEAAVRYGVKRVIYISTMGVYGHRRHHDADEMTPVRPDTTFSRSKAEAEKIILAHHSKGDFQGIILRHRFVYGEGDAHVIPRMIRAARKYPFLINRGRAKVSLVLVNDLAEIIGSFALKDFPLDDPPIYHVTDGVPIGYRDIIMILCDAYGFKRPKWSIPFWLLYGPVRLYEILRRVDPEAAKSNLSSIRLKLVGQDQYYSNLKLRRILPNLNFISFREGFPDLIDYYKQYQ